MSVSDRDRFPQTNASFEASVPSTESQQQDEYDWTKLSKDPDMI